MTTPVLVLHGLALLAYVLGGVLYGANLALRAPSDRPLAGAPRWLLVAGAVLQTAGIGAFCVSVRQSPFASGFGTLSVASWAVALIYLPFAFTRQVPSLGAFILPIAAVLLFAGIARSDAAVATAPLLKNRIVSLHVLLILFSFALFALAAGCAVLFVWQHALLKRPGRTGLFRRLPPLETVDRLAYHLVAFALPLLTLGLALGIIRAAHTPVRGGWIADPKTIVSFALWGVYGAFLIARSVGGWRGTRLHYLLIAGLIVTIALYFVPSPTHRFV